MKEVEAKTILNKHRKRDSWFLDDYSVNPYLGCGFGCVYCYIHGGRYGGTELAVKVNAPELLARELRRRAERREYGFIAFSSSTEPWQQLEEKYRLTRRLLEIVAHYRFPVHVLTKSTLILRDLDVLRVVEERAILPRDLEYLGRGVLITFSFSTLDEGLARVFEPGAPPPRERLRVMERCVEEGFMVGAAFIPILPYLSDRPEELREMFREAGDHGASYFFAGALTLQGAEKEAYYRILEKEFPDIVPKYRALYRKGWAPPRSYQAALEEEAKRICAELGLRYRLR